MRTSLYLSALLLVCGVARAQETQVIAHDPSPPSVAPGDHASGYYGVYGFYMQDGYGHGGQSAACCTPGCCRFGCKYHLHLWHGYCQESAECPCCGYSLGSAYHGLFCPAGKKHCAPVHSGCSSCSCTAGGHDCGAAGVQWEGAAPPKDKAGDVAPPMQPKEDGMGPMDGDAPPPPRPPGKLPLGDAGKPGDMPSAKDPMTNGPPAPPDGGKGEPDMKKMGETSFPQLDHEPSLREFAPTEEERSIYLPEANEASARWPRLRSVLTKQASW